MIADVVSMSQKNEELYMRLEEKRMKMEIGILVPCTLTTLPDRILPAVAFLYKEELTSTRASCTLPSQPTHISQNK